MTRTFNLALGAIVVLVGCDSAATSETSAAGEDAATIEDASTVEALPDPFEGLERVFTFKMHHRTGETPFTQLAYDCSECSFEQFAAIEVPADWSKGPTQVIIPTGELRSAPSFDGVVSSMDFVDEIPGDEFELIAKTLSGTIIDSGGNGIMAVVEVMRDTVLRYPAGARVHELADPDGNVFVLFGYEVASRDFDSPNFHDADALLDYSQPEGWAYSTRIMDEDLVMETNSVATVLSIQQEPTSVWQQR